MSVLAVILTLILLAIVLWIVTGPLRSNRRSGQTMSARRAELEAAREAKYREIRDLELDYRTGKLSWDDYEVTNEGLRIEALAILNEIQQIEGTEPVEGLPLNLGGPPAAPAADTAGPVPVEIRRSPTPGERLGGHEAAEETRATGDGLGASSKPRPAGP